VDEILQFLVSAEPKHFVAAASRVSGVQIRIDQIVERFEFERELLRQDRAKLFGHDVRGAARESGMVCHENQAAFFAVGSVENRVIGTKELSGIMPGAFS